MKEKFYRFLSAMAIGLMLILAIGDRWEGLSVFLAIQSFSSFFGVFLGIASFIGRIHRKINMPYCLDFVIFAIGTINVVNKFLELF